MKFRCEREALAEALATASRATSGRNTTLPVLTGLRLELTGDQLTVTGTDLDLTIRVSLTVGGESDGGTVLPARLATDIVRSLASGKVELAAEADDVSISSGRSQFSVRPLAFDDYPKLPAPTASAVTLPAATFGESLRQVVRAASTDDSRPILTGVLLAAEGDGMRMVATDSYRLAVRDIGGQHVFTADQKVLVPGRALNELQRLMGAGGDVTMRIGEGNATFGIGNVELTTQLIQGEFPDYSRLIPSDHSNVLTVEREPLLEAIRRAKVLAKDATPVRLHLGGDTLRITAITQDVGNASEELDATYEGGEMTVAFNPDYLVAGVEACVGDAVTLTTRDGLKPAVLRGVGVDDYLYLLMPVRVP